MYLFPVSTGEIHMTVVSIRTGKPLAEPVPAATRVNGACIRDIGQSDFDRRAYAIEKLQDALRVFRTVFSPTDLVVVLERKLVEEKRLTETRTSKMASPFRPDSAARSCECILHTLVEQLVEAEGVARGGGLTQIAVWIHERIESLEGELLPEVRALVAMLEAEARKS